MNQQQAEPNLTPEQQHQVFVQRMWDGLYLQALKAALEQHDILEKSPDELCVAAKAFADTAVSHYEERLGRMM